MRQPNQSRRAVLVALAASAVGFGAGAWAKSITSAKVIKISAKRFVFTPNTLKLKKGQPVTLELTTEDVLMGFNAPDFAMRTDIVPGQTARLRFTPDKAGTFTFLCDVFCGSGHENMNGTLIVSDT